MTSQADKCKVFAELHRSDGAWVIPNPWDVGSAKLLEGMGFKALATTSSGFAFTYGRGDGEVSLQEKVEHCRALCGATAIPVNADFENGYSDDTGAMCENIEHLLPTGIAGLSIEDFSRDSKIIYSLEQSVERIQAAAETIAKHDAPVMLTARAENLLRGVNDLEDTIARLQAYSKAGADVLYAPGVNSLKQLEQITAEIDKPFNVLAPFMPDATVVQFSEAGATRISVGGALNLASIAPILAAGKEMLEQGGFSWAKNIAQRPQVQ